MEEPPDDRDVDPQDVPDEGAGAAGDPDPIPEPPPDADDNRPVWSVALPEHDRNEFLRVHTAGEKVGARTVGLSTASAFLTSLRKALHGLTGWIGQVPISTKNEIAFPTGAAEPLFAGLVNDHSIVFVFELGSEEIEVYIPEEDEYRYQTELAAERMIDVLGSDDIQEAVQHMLPLNDRVANSLVELVELVAHDKLDTEWATPRRPVVSFPAERAISTAVALREELLEVTQPEDHSGELFRADSRRNTFRFEPTDGDAFTGSYPESLEPWVREAWGKTVNIRVRSTLFRYPYEERPHRREFELVDRPEIAGSPDV